MTAQFRFGLQNRRNRRLDGCCGSRPSILILSSLCKLPNVAPFFDIIPFDINYLVWPDRKCAVMTSTFFPRRPPFPFSSSARKSTTYCISRPSLSHEPVKGRVRPILIVPAARAVSPMRHRTNDRNRIFFTTFSLQTV